MWNWFNFSPKSRHFQIIVNIRNILTETRSVIERIGHPASAPFPHDSETLRDAISKVFFFI